jgi:hypothetical protein
VRFEVILAVKMTITVFWDMIPCSLVNRDRQFSALHMEAVRSSETLVRMYQTTRLHIPEGSKRNLQLTISTHWEIE